ncbi:anaphase-promoting complex subunit 2-like isoform X2 [Watersipora subatra]|uniref:anaphase-promoting complex subunit 2-like isoform X2 n=1 Tax=Watersipora subatra TaxID=2589382 RepID=UPI00355B50FA
MEAAWKCYELAKQPENSISQTQVHEALKVLIEGGVGAAIEQTLYKQVENSIKENLSTMIHTDITFPCFVNCVFEHMEQSKRSFLHILKIFAKLTNSSRVPSLLHRAYLTTLQYPHHRQIYKLAGDFYLSAYLAFGSSQKMDDDMVHDEGSKNDSQEACQLKAIVLQMRTIRQQAQELDLFQDIIEEALIGIVQSRIKEQVTTVASGVFGKEVIGGLLDWLSDDLVHWLSIATERQDTSAMLSSEHLRYHLYDSFVRLRLDEMLSMIIDYPDSKASFEDLHFTLPNTNLRGELIANLKKVYENRILHPGVTTTDILTAYIQSIQALRLLDPSSVLLEIVTEPVKHYLRSRDDTVRCIVSNLIDESCEVLADELTKAVSDQDIVDEDNIGDDWDKWEPDPVDANPETSSKTRRSTDIINMLVNIYGSKELFIKEYWNLLADRLLSNLSYATLWEIRYFELLKVRFGETDLHKCEVMLKDITDSKRLNTWIHSELLKAPPDQQIPFEMNAMMLSGQYWPNFREEKLQLPLLMQSALNKYTKAYEIAKVNRTLKWQPHIGQIEVDIEMDSGQVLSFKTSPVNVAIITAFETKDSYNAEELSQKLQTSVSVIRKRITYWLTHRVLQEQSPNSYKLNKDHTFGTITDIIEEDSESAMASAEEQREEEFQILWTYVNGMLTNMESQSLERIHSMLKMFANTECTLTELENFLSRKIREGKLVCTAGVYKLAK